SQLGARLARPGRVARVLAAEADLPGRMARQPGEARRARGRVGRRRGRVRLPAPGRRAAAARARPRALLARAAVPRLTRPLAMAGLGIAYLVALLAVDHFVTFREQVGLGAVTWVVLIVALTRVPLLRRAQALGVVIFATVGEVTGSILWGV